MKNKTAVEWLEEKFNNYDISTGKSYFRKLLNEAKQMEKEQIQESFDYGIYIGTYTGDLNGKEYYNETFKKK